MNFSTMITELSDRTGVYDSTIATDSTKLQRWLNMAQQDITSRANWPFMVYHEIIQSVLDITTGTCAVNAAGTTVTLSTPPTPTTLSCVDWFIKINDEANWYRVTAHTANTAVLTISPAYSGSTNLTTANYKLRKLWYATSTPLDSILTIKKMTPGRFLESANSRDCDMFLPLYWDSGAVYKYIQSVPGSDGEVRVSFLYSPSSVENYQVTGIKKLADMVVTTNETSIIPSRWHNAIIDLAAFYAFSSVDDIRAADFYKKADLSIQNMLETYDGDLGRQRVSRSLVTGILEGPAYVLPPQYGVNQG